MASSAGTPGTEAAGEAARSNTAREAATAGTEGQPAGAATRDQTGPAPAFASSGPAPAATPVEACTVRCLTNAQYHGCREAFLDTLHRWFMFFVIALGTAALTDVLPKLVYQTVGWTWDPALVKEMCAAGAAILAALDLTFDLSNRARAHALMKRRYYELLADLREKQKSPSEVFVCLERFSADEEPPYKVLLLSCWNAAQQTVYGNNALRYDITFKGNLFKNWWRRPAADYPVIGGSS